MQDELDVENKSLRKAYFQQGWLIFAIVLCAAVAIGAIVVITIPEITAGWDYPRQNIITGSVLAILITILGMATAIWVIVQKTAPRIKELKFTIAHLEEHRNSLIAVATEQMKPLNNLFERYMSSRLMEKTYPLIKLDDYFDIKRYDCLNRKYGLWDNQNVNCSAIFIQSGEINGNPFCFFTNLQHNLGTKIYSGHLTVYWTETEKYTDSDGKQKLRTVQRSETLTGYVTKACPYYHTDVLLVYGNEAAPNLSFSREDTDAEHWDEKRTEKEVNRRIKKINAQMRNAVSEGKKFTSMGNEFEALFGATNRDNEVEFRVLFTPLAQREMLKLIKDKTFSWGDDFNFAKIKMLNLIGSDHLTGYDMSGNPSNYRHYDIDTIRKQFNDYNNEYFRAVYFAFTPLLAIPLYQQHKPHEFIYKDVMKSIAALRSGKNVTETNRSELAGTLDSIASGLKISVEAYPNLQAHAAIADAMQKNDYLQREITAAREVYNDAIMRWNQDIFAWPTKMIVAARAGYTTRIPFTASREIKEQARSDFF